MLKLYQNIKIEFHYFSILNSCILSQNLQLSVKVVIKLLSISCFVCLLNFKTNDVLVHQQCKVKVWLLWKLFLWNYIVSTTKMKEVKNKNAHMNMLVLPQEILQMVFKFLDPRTIFSISQVSKFNNLSSFNI